MYSRSRGKVLKHIDFLAFDIIVMAISYTFSCFMRYDFKIPERWASLFLRCGVALIVIYFVVALVNKNYNDILQRNKWAEIGKVFTQIILTHILFVLYLYVVKENDFSRQIYIVSSLLSFVGIWCWRVLWKHIIRVFRVRNDKLPQLLVLVDRSNAVSLVSKLNEKKYDYFRINGVVLYEGREDASDNNKFNNIDDDFITITNRVTSGVAGSGDTVRVPIVCNADSIEEYMLNNVIDEVFVCISDDEKKRKIINYCLELGITIHIGMAFAKMDYPNMLIEDIGGNTVLTTSNNVTVAWKLIVKRFADIVGGVLGCIIMLIMYPVIAGKIKKADPGPVFFTQERVGKNGRKFKIFKFRSMYQNAEELKSKLMEENEMDGFIFKMENDPRILPGIGKKIRETSIDEWPQFINVLKGDMSLVGTRPPTVDEYLQYEPHHKARLGFKPGITGLWQVSGRSNITDFEKIVELDNTYIREWSLLLDLKILVKTVAVVMSHDGAE